MRTTVRVGGTIAATPEVLFAAVADYRQAPLFIDGLQSLKPVGAETTGEGAAFEAVIKVGPKVFSAEIVIAAVVQDRAVTWASADGDGQSISFKMKPADGGTQIVMEVSYEKPSGFTGVLAAPVVEETIRSRAHASMRRLRDHVT